MGGVVCGNEIDTEVVHSEGEGGGQGCVCTKAGVVSHRGVAVGLEVADKALVGDDAGFFQPIHYLPEFDVDIATRVGKGGREYLTITSLGMSFRCIRMYWYFSIGLFRQ